MYLEIQYKDRVSLETIHELNVDENVRQFKENEISENKYFGNMRIETVAYEKLLMAIQRYNDAQH